MQFDSTDEDFIIIKKQNKNQKKNKPDYEIIEDFTNYTGNTECQNKYAKSVLISKCGHVGIVGYNNGEIHSFNMQSLKYRKEYKTNKYSLKSKAHTDGDVLKMHLYDINYFVSASNSKTDRNIKVWNIYTGELIYTYDITNNDYKTKAKNTTTNEDKKNIYITSLYHQGILTTVCMSDNKVFIIDIEQQFVSRKFHFAFEVVSIIFSKDNRLIFFAFKNNSLLTYEIISNTFIDFVIFKNPITSMIYNDIQLYTAHENTPNCMWNWTNKNLYSLDIYNSFIKDYNVCEPIEIDKCSDDEKKEAEAEAEAETEKGKLKKSRAILKIQNIIKSSNEMTDKNDLFFLGTSVNGKSYEQNKNKDPIINEELNLNKLMIPYKSNEQQINEHLLTMSGLNISRIAHLVFLDQIKEKCKVEENVKKNEQIPFFLSLKLDGHIEYVDFEEKNLIRNITGIDKEEEKEEKEKVEEEEEEETQNKIQNENQEIQNKEETQDQDMIHEQEVHSYKEIEKDNIIEVGKKKKKKKMADV